MVAFTLATNLSYVYTFMHRHVHTCIHSQTCIHVIKYCFCFHSSKFYRKIHFIDSLQLLSESVPLDQFVIPAAVLRLDPTTSVWC